MADNIEGSAANSMAGSHSSGRGAVKDLTKNLWLFGGRTDRNSSNSGSSSSSSSSSTGGGDGTTGNGWTAQDYANHNEYKENEHRRANETADNDVMRHVTKTSSDTRLQEATKNADLQRSVASKRADAGISKDLLTHATNHGQVANIDINNDTGRHQVSFRESPVRETNPGNGAGAQGTSKQQTASPKAKTSRPGAKRELLTSPLDKNDPRAAAGHTHVTESLTRAEIDRRAKAASANSGTKPGKTAAQVGAKAGTKPGMTAAQAAATPVRTRTSRAKKA
jgi:hypothetical protein